MDIDGQSHGPSRSRLSAAVYYLTACAVTGAVDAVRCGGSGWWCGGVCGSKWSPQCAAHDKRSGRTTAGAFTVYSIADTDCSEKLQARAAAKATWVVCVCVRVVRPRTRARGSHVCGLARRGARGRQRAARGALGGGSGRGGGLRGDGEDEDEQREAEKEGSREGGERLESRDGPACVARRSRSYQRLHPGDKGGKGGLLTTRRGCGPRGRAFSFSARSCEFSAWSFS